MKNEEKFKTAEERVKAFMVHRGYKAALVASIANKFAHWLALEAEKEKEKPEPCFYCGSECVVSDVFCMRGDENKPVEVIEKIVKCKNDDCLYTATSCKDEQSAIAAHNRVARAVAKAGGAK